MKYRYFELADSIVKTKLSFKTRRTEYMVGSDSRDAFCVIGVASLLEYQTLPPFWQLL